MFMSALNSSNIVSVSRHLNQHLIVSSPDIVNPFNANFSSSIIADSDSLITIFSRLI